VVGRVARAELGRAEVEISDPEALGRLTVSDLVAFDCRAAEESLVGLVSSLTSAAADVTLVGTFRPGGGAEAFKRGADHFPQVGGMCRLIEGEQLHGLMSTLGDSVPDGQRLVLGSFVAEPQGPAIADGDRLFQRHAALLGNTGTGKSWAVAHMLERAAQLPHANMVVFDLHGEYEPLTRAAGGAEPMARRFRVAGPNDVQDPGDDAIFIPYWLLTRDELLSLVLDATDPDAPTQAMRLGDHVHKLRRSALLEEGLEETAATITVDSPVPYRLQNLVQWLRSDDVEKVLKQSSGEVVPGVFAGRLTRFVARLEARISDGRYGFMFTPPASCLEHSWLVELVEALLRCDGHASGIKVIDFSEVPAEALPVVTGVIARLLYDVQFWMDPDGRTPLCLVCDEAHRYIPVTQNGDAVHRQSLRAFEQIAKEGRKYGVALLIVSQRPADVSRTVLSQCNNFIVMRLTNDHDQHVVEQLMPESMSEMVHILPLLDVGEAVVLGDALRLPTRVKFDVPTIQPASATRSFWTDWATTSSSDGAIAAGVESLRRQLRGGSAPPAREPGADANGRAPTAPIASTQSSSWPQSDR
jgi:hypothetical protein